MEFQFDFELRLTNRCRDWKKLTFYYFAETYVNFNPLVTDLFKIYKTRIWMSAINPASFAATSPSLGPPVNSLVADSERGHLVSGLEQPAEFGKRASTGASWNDFQSQSQSAMYNAYFQASSRPVAPMVHVDHSHEYIRPPYMAGRTMPHYYPLHYVTPDVSPDTTYNGNEIKTINPDGAYSDQLKALQGLSLGT